jgi:hypothetical protein
MRCYTHTFPAHLTQLPTSLLSTLFLESGRNKSAAQIMIIDECFNDAPANHRDMARTQRISGVTSVREHEHEQTSMHLKLVEAREDATSNNKAHRQKQPI